MYPSNIPGPCMPYSGKYVENIQRTQMTGELRYRKKFTQQHMDFNLVFNFNSSQFNIFTGWYEANDNGAAWDDMMLLIRGNMETVEIKFLEQITFAYDKRLNIHQVAAKVRARV